MDYKYIEQLLERYWDGETSLEEEQILRTFFSQKNVPARLLAYRDLFCYEQSETATDTLGSGFDARMAALIEEPEPVKARTISFTQRLMPLFKAAAVVAITLTLGNAAQVAFTESPNQPANLATYQKVSEGPEVAMGDTLKPDTLKAVAPVVKVIK